MNNWDILIYSGCGVLWIDSWHPRVHSQED